MWWEMWRHAWGALERVCEVHPLGLWKQGWECPQTERERTAQEHWLKANRARIAVFRNLLPNHAAYWLHPVFTTVLCDINDSRSTVHEGEYAWHSPRCLHSLKSPFGHFHGTYFHFCCSAHFLLTETETTLHPKVPHLYSAILPCSYLITQHATVTSDGM